MKLVAIAVLAMVGHTLAGGPAAADPAALAAAKRTLQDGVNGGNVETLLKARGQFLALAAAEPKSAAAHYWLAVADWRLVPMFMRKEGGEEKAKLHCKEGIQQAEVALTLDPKFAEALALKVGLQGLAFSFNPAAGMMLGAEMEESIQRAVAMAPQNPRVLFLDALNTLNKPAFVGGGADKALVKFRKSIELFTAAAVADSVAPDWGRDDAFLWAGRSAMKMNDSAAALDFYRKALEANPANGWVRHGLIPEAEKALKAQEGGKAKS
jgi:tetratricopeptide (TPR) repeat protein